MWDGRFPPSTAYGIECAFCGKKVRRGYTVSPIRAASPDSASQDAYPLQVSCSEDIEEECYFYRNMCHPSKRNNLVTATKVLFLSNEDITER